MSRPSSRVILENCDEISNKTLQVMEPTEVWTVSYQGRPISIKQLSPQNIPRPIYKRTVFQSRGNAQRLADRLNKRFSVDDFSIQRICMGDNK